VKLFLGLIFGVFGLFIVACAVGFYLPATLEIERSTIVSAYEEDIFPYLNDLKQYQSWAALDARLRETTVLTGGAESGLGQTQAWQDGPKGYEVGSREIVQESAPEFVQLRVTVNGEETTTTHAVFRNPDDTVTVLSKREIPQPGFPYINRVRGRLTKSQIGKNLETALSRLRTQIEANQ